MNIIKNEFFKKEKMKLNIFFILFLLFVGISPSFSQFDDLYYDPETDYIPSYTEYIGEGFSYEEYPIFYYSRIRTFYRPYYGFNNIITILIYSNPWDYRRWNRRNYWYSNRYYNPYWRFNYYTVNNYYGGWGYRSWGYNNWGYNGWGYNNYYYRSYDNSKPKNNYTSKYYGSRNNGSSKEGRVNPRPGYTSKPTTTLKTNRGKTYTSSPKTYKSRPNTTYKPYPTTKPKGYSKPTYKRSTSRKNTTYKKPTSPRPSSSGQVRRKKEK